jgi:hypothetical protein
MFNQRYVFLTIAAFHTVSASNLITGGIATQSSDFPGGYLAANMMDGDLETYATTDNGALLSFPFDW